MRVLKDEPVAVVAQFNPWWHNAPIADLPEWRRAAFHELHTWLTALIPSRRLVPEKVEFPA